MTLPITLLTGFLGSGKTTFLNRLLRSSSMKNTLVVVNEIGDIPVDHLLVREIDERTVVLPSGCLCCSLREDLLEVLDNSDLMRGRDHVVVETSGLADPTPLVATIVRHPAVRERFHLSSIVATLDGTSAADVCAKYVEAPKQLALADRVIITKCDLASDDEVRVAQTLARSLSPACDIVHAPFDTTSGDEDEDATSFDASRHLAAPDGAHEHTHGIRTFSVESDEAVEYPALALWLSAMSQFHGDRLLRFKGLLRVTHQAEPMVIQAVQHVVYPVCTLPSWPEGVVGTRLTGITHGMSEAFFEEIVRSLQKTVKVPSRLVRP